MVEFPEMRAEAIEALRAIADPDYQRRMWVEEVGQHPRIIENLDTNIHILYDDTRVAEVPYERIGTILRTESEARALEEFDHVMSPFLDSLDSAADDATIIAMPQWQAIVAAAQKALQVLTEGNAPNP